MEQALNSAALCAYARDDRSVVALGGADKRGFLQGLITNDIEQLSPSHALYAGLLTPQGKILFDFFCVDRGDVILVDVARADCAALVQRLGLYKLRAKVTIEDASARMAVLSLPDEGAAALLGLSKEAGNAALVDGGAAFVDPRHAGLGAHLILPRHHLAQDLDRLGATLKTADGHDGYDVARYRLGIAEGAEIGAETIYALEANFDAIAGVDFKKGCFIGQEVTARMKHRDAVRKRVLPVAIDGPLPEAGETVTCDGSACGRFLGGAGAHGLALVKLDQLTAETEDGLRAGPARLTVNWPCWLPR